MTKPNLIVLFGNMRVGKSTLAEGLDKHHSYKRISLADPVRAIAGAIRKAPFFLQPGMPYPVREVQQAIGQGARDAHETIWIDIAVAKVNQALEDGFNVVVDDGRYLTDYNGFQMLMINRWPDLHMQMLKLEVSEDERFRRWANGRVMKGADLIRMKRVFAEQNAHPSEDFSWADDLFPPRHGHVDRHVIDSSGAAPQDVLRTVEGLWRGTWRD